MRTQHLSPNATCTFQYISDDAQKPNGLLKNPDIVIPEPHRSVQGEARDEGRRSSAAQADQVDFGQYVDEVCSVDINYASGDGIADGFRPH